MSSRVVKQRERKFLAARIYESTNERLLIEQQVKSATDMRRGTDHDSWTASLTPANFRNTQVAARTLQINTVMDNVVRNCLTTITSNGDLDSQLKKFVC